MTLDGRMYLIGASLLLSGFIAYVASDLSQGFEPHAFSAARIIFRFSVGLVFATPLWLPAVVPQSWPRLARVLLLGSLVGCVALIGLYGSVVVHQLGRYFAGHELHWVPLVTSATAVALCACAFRIIFASERAMSRART
jgi:hypothetical protein